MPFLKSHPADAAPANVFTAYPEIYAAWSKMSEALMNGPSPLTPAERELILAYAAGVAGCRFVCVAHSEVAHALGIEPGLIERLVEDPESAPVEPKLKPPARLRAQAGRGARRDDPSGCRCGVRRRLA